MPGQSCRARWSRTAAVSSGAGRPKRSAARLRKCAKRSGDVAPPLAQGRDAQGDHVQPVVEVLAEAAARGRIAEIDLGRRDHAQVEPPPFVGAERLDLAGLEHAQELDLDRRRAGLDLVEEQRAAVRVLDPADALAVGTGEGSGLVPEELALEHRLGQRAAVERDEVARLPPAPVVQQPRHHLLARAGLAEHQHVDVGVGDLADRLAQPPDARGVADQRQVGRRLGRRRAQPPVLEHQPPLLGGVGDGGGEALAVERLGDEVVGAVLQRRHRQLDVAVPGHEQHRQLAVERLDRAGTAAGRSSAASGCR